ncbi:MAG: carbohydrate kinase [Rhodoferax sp.]|nr:carbohydrate kinase [Rhodoferax sp.]
MNAVGRALPQVVSLGEALTDMVRVGDSAWQSVPGGSGWNVARAAAALGVRSAFAGAISRDCFGDAIWTASERSQLDTRFLQRLDKAPLLAIVHATHPPEYFFVGNDAADLGFDPDQLPAGWDANLPWAHFGGISLTREPLASRLIGLAQKLRAQGTRISYDPNFRNVMTPAYLATLRTMVGLADVVKVSDEDLLGLMPTLPAQDALTALQGWNPSARILHTHGAEGATLWHLGVAAHCPAFVVDVADTVGAGDASVAGLLYSLLQAPDAPSHHHVRWAMACGAAACMGVGPSPATREEVTCLLETR